MLTILQIEKNYSSFAKNNAYLYLNNRKTQLKFNINRI